MFIWTAQPPRAEAIGAPTPLLTHLAGDFAPRVAGLWPQPHRAFVEAAAERRHLVCLALAGTSEQLSPTIASAAIAAPFRRAVRQVAPRAPEGLARALGRLGEVAWAAEDYRLLVDLLGRPGAGEVLRHRAELSRELLRRFGALTAPLHAAGLSQIELTGPQADLLSRLHAALARRDGDQGAMAAARRWGAGGSAADVFMRAIASVRRELPTPPFPDTDRLRAMRTLPQLDEAGGRYNNCLNGLSYAGDRDYAWYEWLGPPGVMIELINDGLYGWALRQARLTGNAPVPADRRTEITAALREMGVHVGMSSWDVVRALRAAREGEPQTSVEQAIGWCYGEDD
jgi:hypothetical protein